MFNLRQSVVHVAIWIVIAIGSVCTFVTSGRARVEDELSGVDSDGTLHIHDLTMSPSELWSPEFKEYYARWVTQAAMGPRLQPPARNAPKAEWDRFDASLEDHIKAGYLDRVLEHYPVKVVDTKVAGVRVAIISPRDGIPPGNRRRVLINLRAGGFVYYRGLAEGELEAIPVASIGRVKIITVDYRQAPFHGYPAASEDVETIYKELLKEYKPDAIGIFGCSAGGALAAQAVAWFQVKGLPRPGAVGIFCSAPSPKWARKGDSGIWWSGTGLPRTQLLEADRAALEPVQWYMDSADSNDPVAYPELSDAVLARFPPTLLLSGTRDFAMSALIVAHARFLKLGVDSSLYIMEGGAHGAYVFAVGTPEAHNTHAYIAAWFDEHLAR